MRYPARLWFRGLDHQDRDLEAPTMYATMSRGGRLVHDPGRCRRGRSHITADKVWLATRQSKATMSRRLQTKACRGGGDREEGMGLARIFLRRCFAASALLVLALVLPASAQKSTLTFGSTNATSSNYALAVAMSKAIKKDLPNTNVT